MNRPPRLLGSILLAVCDLKDTGGSSVGQITNYLKTRSKKDNLPASETAISTEIHKALNYGTKNLLLAAHGGKFRMSSKFLSPMRVRTKEKLEDHGMESDVPIQEGKRRRRKFPKSRKTRRRRRKSGRMRSSSLQIQESDNSEIIVARRRRRGRKPAKRSPRRRRSRTRSRSIHAPLENMEHDQDAMEPIAPEDTNEEATIEEIAYPDDLPETVEAFE